MILSLFLTLGLFVFGGVVLTVILVRERRYLFALGASCLTLAPLYNLWQGVEFLFHH